MENYMLDKVLAMRKKALLEKLSLYLITDRSRFEDSVHGDSQFLDTIAACLDGGIQIVQLNESTDVPGRRILSLAKSLRTLTSEMDALLIINQRADIARAVDADGLHLGPRDLDIHSARKVLGSEMIIGHSVHSHAEAEALLGEEIDYLSAGPVFASEMVPGQPAVGSQLLNWMAAHVELPWFAAGGIDIGSITQVLSAGATRVAITRCLMRSKDPGRDTRRIIEALTPQSVS